MLRPHRRPPSVHSLDPGPDAARPRVRCRDCGALAPEPRVGRPGAPAIPRCLACGFLATVADAGTRDSMHLVLRRVEALASAELLGPAGRPAAPPLPAGAAGGPTVPAPAADGAQGHPAVSAQEGGPSSQAQARPRRRPGIIVRTAAHTRAAKAHVVAAAVYARAAAAHIERTRARIESFRGDRAPARAPV